MSSDKSNANYAIKEAGPLTSWPSYKVELPGIEIPGKLFLKEMLGLTGCEISINSMEPGDGMPIYHSHNENEEVYMFIGGRGQVQVDGDTIDVKEGSIVRISPNGERVWRNNGDEPLIYIIIQTRENSLTQYGVPDANIPDKEIVWADK
jgi:mannose-6-phosphate isomerase-like protein (cupin superfamily)